jgi:hypothetical protein
LLVTLERGAALLECGNVGSDFLGPAPRRDLGEEPFEASGVDEFASGAFVSRILLAPQRIKALRTIDRRGVVGVSAPLERPEDRVEPAFKRAPLALGQLARPPR